MSRFSANRAFHMNLSERIAQEEKLSVMNRVVQEDRAAHNAAHWEDRSCDKMLMAIAKAEYKRLKEIDAAALALRRSKLKALLNGEDQIYKKELFDLQQKGLVSIPLPTVSETALPIPGERSTFVEPRRVSRMQLDAQIIERSGSGHRTRQPSDSRGVLTSNSSQPSSRSPLRAPFATHLPETPELSSPPHSSRDSSHISPLSASHSPLVSPNQSQSSWSPREYPAAEDQEPGHLLDFDETRPRSQVHSRSREPSTQNSPDYNDSQEPLPATHYYQQPDNSSDPMAYNYQQQQVQHHHHHHNNNNSSGFNSPVARTPTRRIRGRADNYQYPSPPPNLTPRQHNLAHHAW